MPEEKTTSQPKDVCTIHIMFGVEDIEEAVAVRKAVADATKELTDAVVDFRVSDSRIAPRRIV